MAKLQGMTSEAKLQAARVMLTRGQTYKTINQALRAQFGSGVSTDVLTDIRRAQQAEADRAVDSAAVPNGAQQQSKGILLLPDGTWEYC